MTKVNFNGKDHTEASVAKMSEADLLKLRNLVATNLGVATVTSFKDQAAGASQTWKALVRYEKAMADEGAGATGDAKPKKAAKPKAAPKPRGLAKSAESKTVKRPSQKMFSTIKKTGEHTAEHGRTHRWPNYKDGMTIVDVIETEGTEPWDVYNWESQGIMSVTLPTDEEFKARKAAWYKKHGLTDPEVAKANAKAEREKAKEEREKAAAEKKAEREEAKAKKAKEREDAKAAKEKAKAGKAKA